MFHFGDFFNNPWHLYQNQSFVVGGLKMYLRASNLKFDIFCDILAVVFT